MSSQKVLLSFAKWICMPFLYSRANLHHSWHLDYISDFAKHVVDGCDQHHKHSRCNFCGSRPYLCTLICAGNAV